MTNKVEAEEFQHAIQFKKLNEFAAIPTKAHQSDAGMDIYGTWYEIEDNCIVVHTDIAMAVPHGYATLIFPRSSIAKTPLRLANSVGLIDADYRGEIILKFKTDVFGQDYMPDLTKAIGQLVVIKLPDLPIIEVDELNDTDRGAGGFGSTNN